MKTKSIGNMAKTVKITRYAIRRKSDGKVYKHNASIYPGIESYWDKDFNKARLWSYKPTDMKPYFRREVGAVEILTLTFTLNK